MTAKRGLPGWTPEQTREFFARRRSRNVALGIALGAFALLILIVTMAKLHA